MAQYVDIYSLSPRNAFLKPLSWKLNVGFSKELPSAEDETVFWVNTGSGFSYLLRPEMLWYTLLELDLPVGDSYEHYWNFGGGVSSGIVGKITDWWNQHLEVKGGTFFIGRKTPSYEISWKHSFSLFPNRSVQFGVFKQGDDKAEQDGIEMSYQWLF